MKEDGKKWNVVVREARRAARSVIIYCQHESLFLSRRHAVNEQPVLNLPRDRTVPAQNYFREKGLPPAWNNGGAIVLFEWRFRLAHFSIPRSSHAIREDTLFQVSRMGK